jgi:pyruvate kinase
MRKTKIIATIGPATSSKAVLKEIIQKGVNICRINCSHGSYDDHRAVIDSIREINDELNTHVGILVDLQGPKIRIHEVENNGIDLVSGETILISTEKVLGTKEKISINYQDLPRDVKPGEHILLDDGKLLLEVLATNGKNEVKCKVVHGGVLSSKKGVNLPNSALSLPSLTPKDLEDLEFALENNADWIGLSFVRNARDIIELKHHILQAQSSARVIAKIEKPEALSQIDDIIAECDALMVARGDLGVEIPLEQVPVIQKMLIKKCLLSAKPVIVATQMMESMITSISPTRAEVNDVANAVLDGADAVMLSGETSVGKFPGKVIEIMCQIVSEMEKQEQIYNKEELPLKNQARFISDSICFNACRLSQRVEAKAIITMTFSGYTAYKVSSQRPKSQILVFTSNKKIMTQLNLVWGVKCYYYDRTVSTDHTIADILYLLKKEGRVKTGDYVINVASIPIEEQGKSNMVKLSQVD